VSILYLEETSFVNFLRLFPLEWLDLIRVHKRQEVLVASLAHDVREEIA